MKNHVVVDNHIMDEWVKEAEKEFRTKGWQNASTNAVMMAVFSEICHRVDSRIDRLGTRVDKLLGPLWTLAGSIACAVIWLIIKSIWGL